MLGRGTSWSTSSGVGKYLVCQRSSKGTTVVGREGGVGETGGRGGERARSSEPGRHWKGLTLGWNGEPSQGFEQSNDLL